MYNIYDKNMTIYVYHGERSVNIHIDTPYEVNLKAATFIPIRNFLF